MPGSPDEPNEAADDPGAVAGARPMYDLPLADRWAMWRRDPRLVAAVLALVALAAGAWWVRVSAGEPSSVGGKTAATTQSTIENFAPSGARATASTTAVFVVDVVGAVRHTGVVSLPATARVIDALTAAGGALPNADLERINLAAHLVDGMRIAVPRRGAPTDPAAPTGDSGAAAGSSGGTQTPDSPLDLNAATQGELEALPGIGPSLAQAIIQERDREGGFHTVDDLRRVRGIGDVRFAQLRELVRV